jgi:hypothetical protein
VSEPLPLPIWHEVLQGVETRRLRASPVYWGFGVPRGDGSVVVVVPAFLSKDSKAADFRAWLDRIGSDSMQTAPTC